MDKHATFQLLHEVFFALCKSIDSPRSLGAWIRFKYKENLALVSLSINPSDYLTAEQFAMDYLVCEYLSKSEVLKTGVNRKAVAIQKFKTSEDICTQTNNRLRVGVPNGTMSAVFFRAQRKIADILGPLKVGSIMSRCQWGPGSTFDILKRDSDPDIKFETLPTCSAHALPYARAYLENSPAWISSLIGVTDVDHAEFADFAFSVVHGNKLTTVPKNAKTERVIAQEPTANSFLQQGVGRYIRDRLMRSGVDLSNQEINQQWASTAHLLDLCTLDLSMASDTIARELVFELLPLDWACFLDSLRSKSYFLDGAWHTYSKFSSMGNAFTFELESLIFYALLYACTCEIDSRLTWSCSVYGDDIICHRDVAPLFIEVLAFAGFKTNVEKSHTGGLFFESCGGHFFNGYNVTPAYQKKQLSGTEVVRAHNRLIRFGLRIGWNLYCDNRVRSSCSALRRAVKDDKVLSRTFIPAGASGDDGFVLCASEWRGKRFSLNYGWRCQVYRNKPICEDQRQRGGLAQSLLELEHNRFGERSVRILRPAREGHEAVLTPWLGGQKEVGLGKLSLAKRWIATPIGGFPDFN